MIKAVLDITKDAVEDKLKSPFYKNFIIGWITWNWKVWYVTFFVSEEILKQDKISYIKEIYTYFDIPYLFPASSFLFHWILMPLLISWIIVYLIRENIAFPFMKKEKSSIEKESKLQVKAIKSETKALQELEKQLNEKEKQLNEIQKSKKSIAKKEEKIINIEEQNWDKEYDKLINKYPDILSKLKTLLVEHKGSSHSWEGNRRRNIATKSEEILLFTSLIEEKERIENGAVIIYGVTKKGKYFLNKEILS